MNVVLVAPEIPPNTGNIARTCAATGTALHLVDPLGFEISDRYLKRAGLDYWPAVNLQRHPDWAHCRAAMSVGKIWCFSVRGKHLYTEVEYAPDDWLVFGRESTGLPAEIIAAHETVRIPIQAPVRSLNLSSSVAISLFEALRQVGTLAALDRQSR